MHIDDSKVMKRFVEDQVATLKTDYITRVEALEARTNGKLRTLEDKLLVDEIIGPGDCPFKDL
jgi:hypothetical protein